MSDSSTHQGKNEIIIVKRRRGGEEGHHGGVWKIAYADFMTALMAFFLVMWLVNAANEETKAAVASYFNPIKLMDDRPTDRGVKEVGNSADGEATARMEAFLTRKVGLSGRNAGFCLLQAGLRLGDRCAIGVVLDLEEQIAGLDLAAFLEGNFLDDAADARAHVGNAGRADPARQFRGHGNGLVTEDDHADARGWHLLAVLRHTLRGGEYKGEKRGNSRAQTG